VAQGVSLEFKPQYPEEKKNNKKGLVEWLKQ
jgi:hypothetical protein